MAAPSKWGVTKQVGPVSDPLVQRGGGGILEGAVRAELDTFQVPIRGPQQGASWWKGFWLSQPPALET